MRCFIIIAALAVGACDRTADRVCGNLADRPPVGVPRTAEEQLKETAYCVEHWAARLAAAPDPASEIVEGVIGACDNAILFHESMKEKEKAGSGQSWEDARKYWRRRAQFIVVQTRAGHCYKDA